MKRLLFALLILLNCQTGFSQEWKTLDGPNSRPSCNGVFDINGQYFLLGTCATFSSDDQGELYLPFREQYGVEDYVLFQGDAYISSYNSPIDKISWSGSEWEISSQSLANLHEMYADDDSIYLVTYSSGIYSSDDGGNWNLINDGIPGEFVHIGPMDSIYQVYTKSICSNDNYLFVGTESGIYRTDKSNVNWSDFSNGLPDTAYTYLEAKGDTVFTVSHNLIYRSVDAGVNWSLNQSLAVGNEVNRIRIINDTVFVLTQSEGLFISEDYGQNWMTMNNGLTSLNVNDIRKMDGEYFITGEQGCQVGINNWVSKDRGAVCAYMGDIEVSQNGIVATELNHLYYLGDDSTDFVNVTESLNSWSMRSVEMVNSELIINIQTDNQSLGPSPNYKSSDNGLNWIQISEFPGPTGPHLLSSKNGLISAEGYDLKWSADDGVSWTTITTLPPPVFGCSGYSTVLFASDAWYVAGCDGFGEINRSTDQGATWSYVDEDLPWGRVTGLYEFGDTIFATTQESLFFTVNQGDNWTEAGWGLPDPYANMQTNFQSMIKWNDIYFVSNAQRVYYSTDGAMWFDIMSNGLPGSFGQHYYGNANLMIKGDTMYFGSGRYGMYFLDLTNFNSVLSSSSVNKNYDLGLYPNPSTGSVSLSLQSEVSNATVTLVSVQNSVVFRAQYKSLSSHEFDFSTFKAGLYFLSIEAEQCSFVEKIILK